MTDPRTSPQTQDEPRDPPFLVPPVQVIEDAGGITLYADLPGVSKSALNLTVDAETLTIEGQVSLDIPPDMEATHREIEVPRYRRVFTLSRELDAGKVNARLDQGVLTLRIPKAEHAQPRRIAVQIA